MIAGVEGKRRLIETPNPRFVKPSIAASVGSGLQKETSNEPTTVVTEVYSDCLKDGTRPIRHTVAYFRLWWNWRDQEDFYQMRLYGPYTSKQDNRKRIIIITDENSRTTMSYARYLVEQSIGRPLLSDEDVHHKDGDVTNDSLGNLEIINHRDHCRFHALKPKHDLETNCIWCEQSFVIPAEKIRDRSRGKTGPFCSRNCSGKYGAEVQRALKEKSFK